MTSKLASLHSGLVARKGEATPAQTNPHFSYVDTPRPDYHRVEPQSAEQIDRRIERQRWPHPAVPVAPVERHAEPEHAEQVEATAPDPIVEREQPRAVHSVETDEANWRADRDLRHDNASPEPRPIPNVPRVAPVAVASTPAEPASDDAQTDPDHDAALRHRFTFRMTHDQRHRLRLAAAIRDQSLQIMLSDALDNHLNGLCACSLKDCACMGATGAGSS